MSFYQYLKTIISPKRTEKQNVVHAMIDDLAFPKQSTDYLEITTYLEDNAFYINDMTIFDELWDEFINK